MEVTRLFDLFPYQMQKFAKSDALAAKENGVWKTYSTQDVLQTINDLSYGLLASGIVTGDKIGIISNNRPEWNFVDHACLQIGVADVPLYPTISEHDLKYTLTESEVKFVFVSSKEIYDKVLGIKASIPGLQQVFTFNEVPGANHWSELRQLGQKKPAIDEVARIRKSILPDSLATIIYTSGTTGNPKGVMLSHNNLISNFKACEVLCPFKETWRALSFLPLNHVYERMLSYLYVYYGVSIYYAESLDTIGDNLKEVKPNIFVTVPRLLEKVYDKIVSKGAELTGVKKMLFFWALDLGLKYELHGKNGWWYETQLKLANKLIFSKWREALGGNVEAVASGGAALQARLARVFHAAKIPVLEGYGLTETSPVIAVNNFQPGCVNFGTVGTVIKGVEVKFGDDGEILCKGPNVMMGYYKSAELTKEVMDDDGWFHTGDIGVIVDDKFLKITDRKKEIFKTSGGKYIIPQMIENKLKESRFIEQAIVIGENQKFAAALITPAFAFVKDWADRKGINLTDHASIAASQEVRKRIAEEIENVNRTLGNYETVKKFELLDRDFLIEKNELTPKLSLRRKVIQQNFQMVITKIFS